MTKARGSASLPWYCALLLMVSAPAAWSADKPGALRAEITRTEDEYFALYNKLNADRRFDMVCRKERATGTSFLTRVCEPRYVIQQKEAVAAERLRDAVSTSAGSSAGNSRGPDVGNASTAAAGLTHDPVSMQDAFRRNMLEVLQKSPELQALGAKRDELQLRLAEATRK